MSTQNPTHGTKVTTERDAPEKEEYAGAVVSDSLAAESTRAGGDFSENKGSEPLGVSGNSSTFANTNTSGAEKLDPASSASARDDPDPSYSTQSKSTAVTDTSGSYATGGETSAAEQAPSYVNSQYVDAAGPKGKNITEGFDDDNGKNASFSTDIGSDNDPGRAAEQKFANINAAVADSSPSQNGSSGGQFDALGGDASS